MKCRICGNSRDNTPHVAREMMYGSRERFDYFECARCGCLQIAEVPDDLARFYPPAYYSLSTGREGAPNRLSTLLKRRRLEHDLGRRSALGALLLRRFGPPDLPSWVREAGLSARARILDVGCGAGELLCRMEAEGFTNLTGIDPHTAATQIKGRHVRIVKGELQQLDEPFDFVMMHHAFEHVHNPVEVFGRLPELLAPEGRVLIRIPTVSSYAWKHYGVHWAQLDAPRHLFLHSVASIELLAQRSGLEVERVVHDSSAFQFWGSEHLRRDIALMEAGSYHADLAHSIFSRAEVDDFERRADELNRSGQGDQAGFYLRRASVSAASRH